LEGAGHGGKEFLSDDNRKRIVEFFAHHLRRGMLYVVDLTRTDSRTRFRVVSVSKAGLVGTRLPIPFPAHPGS
jgi:hypothetical protein